MPMEALHLACSALPLCAYSQFFEPYFVQYLNVQDSPTDQKAVDRKSRKNDESIDRRLWTNQSVWGEIVRMRMRMMTTAIIEIFSASAHPTFRFFFGLPLRVTTLRTFVTARRGSASGVRLRTNFPSGSTLARTWPSGATSPRRVPGEVARRRAPRGTLLSFPAHKPSRRRLHLLCRRCKLQQPLLCSRFRRLSSRSRQAAGPYITYHKCWLYRRD